jgi:hypothetical protein
MTNEVDDRVLDTDRDRDNRAEAEMVRRLAEAEAEEQLRNQAADRQHRQRQRSRSRSPLRRTEDARQDGSGPSGSSVTYNVTATELVELVRVYLATNNTSANVPGPQKAGPLAAVHEALAELRTGKAEERGTR